MKQEDQEIYKDFLVWAFAYLLPESGEWIGKVNILRKEGKTIRPFLSEKTFETQEDAIRNPLKLGKLIIDGKIPGCHVEDI